MNRNLGLNGAGDRDRTGDIQLGKLASNRRHKINQRLRKGTEGPGTALWAPIEHNSEHNFRPEGSRLGHTQTVHENDLIFTEIVLQVGETRRDLASLLLRADRARTGAELDRLASMLSLPDINVIRSVVDRVLADPESFIVGGA